MLKTIVFSCLLLVSCAKRVSVPYEDKWYRGDGYIYSKLVGGGGYAIIEVESGGLAKAQHEFCERAKRVCITGKLGTTYELRIAN